MDSKQKLYMTHIDENGNIKTNTIFKNVYKTFPNKNIVVSGKEFLLLIQNKKYELELAKFQVSN